MTPGFKLLLFGLILFASFWVYQIRESDVMSLVDRMQDPELYRPPSGVAESRRSPEVHPVRDIVLARFLPRDAIRNSRSWDDAAPADDRMGEDEIDPEIDDRIDDGIDDGIDADGDRAGVDMESEETEVEIEIRERSDSYLAHERDAEMSDEHEAPPERTDAPTRPTQPEAVDYVEIEHIVKSDERLWTIARRYFGRGTDFEKIARWNGLREKNPVIIPGMRLKIRVPRQEFRKQEVARERVRAREKETRSVVHTVRRGDNLAVLARRYYRSEANSESWQKIYRANRKVLKNPNRLVIGTKLTIPDVVVSGAKVR